MEKMTRRGMVAAIGAAGVGSCICTTGCGCATFSKVGRTEAIAAEAYRIEDNALVVALDKAPLLSEVGGSIKVIDPRLPTALIIARTGVAEYVVVSLLCPHRGVEVEYQPKEGQFRCASLGHSKFTTEGKLIKGMTKKSLGRYIAALDATDKNHLVIDL